MAVYISSRFDSGAIQVVSAERADDIHVRVPQDGAAEFAQWFHFRVQGVGELTLPRPEVPPPLGAMALAFRPHQVSIRVRDEHGDASRIWLDGRVESSEFLGETSRYRVRAGETLIVANQAHFSGLSLFPPGAEVRLGIEPTQVRFLDR